MEGVSYVIDMGLRAVGAVSIAATIFVAGRFLKNLGAFCDTETRKAPKLTDEYKGKVVWITGGSSGIGKELARQLGRQGAKLILSSRREAVLLEVKEELLADPTISLTADDIKIVPLDLEKIETMDAAAEKALAHWGYVDVLVNNGGISTRGLGRDATLDVDVKLMNIDFLSTVALARACIPAMTKNGGGRIINMSSAAGKIGVPLRTAYCAAKFAVLGWFDALRMEEFAAGSGINVTNVCPGSVQTDVGKNAIGADGKPMGVTDPNIGNGLPVEFVAERTLAAAHADVDEVWLAKGPELFGLYFIQYFPAEFKRDYRPKAKEKMKDMVGKPKAE